MRQILPSAPEIFSLETWLSLHIENGDSYRLQESSSVYRTQGPVSEHDARVQPSLFSS